MTQLILIPLPSNQSANTLEKVGHQYHMHEIYKEAAVMYNEMLEDSSLDQQVCSCANDVLENGVLDQLLVIAKRFKYAARDGRARKFCYINICGLRFDYIELRQGSGMPDREKRSTDGDIARLEEEYLDNTNKETAEALLEAGAGWQPNTVTGPEQWVAYSAMLTSSLPSNQMIRDFATFIYCKLNYPEPKEE